MGQDEGLHRFEVKAEGGFGGGDHLVGCDAGVGQKIAILVGELADEFALSATVALTEWMKGVDLGEVVGESSGDIAGGEVF